MALAVRNWSEFQHYRGRRPPWIKLHRTLLDNPDWHKLPDASKALAPMLWLLASESDDGRISLDIEKIAFRIRWEEGKVVDSLKPLIERRFFLEDEDGAIGVLAPRSQVAPSESEREREDYTPPTSSTDSTSRKALSAADKRGTRLADDWNPTPGDRDFASDLGLDPELTADEFRDYWTSLPGARGRKLDWSKTFRNRCRELGKKTRANGHKPNRDAEMQAAIERGMKVTL